ncbi:MAG: hypothetical protein KAH97_06260 [Anaerolineales bacterium]|nr:hypothetical protein [Anaerolineales bacterium]
MRLTAVLLLIFGLGFLLAPEQIMSPFGIEVSLQLKSNEQLYGISLVSLAVLAWSSRNSSQSELRRSVLPALLAYFVLGAIVTFTHQLKGLANILGWGVVVMHTLFAGLFGYFYFSPLK